MQSGQFNRPAPSFDFNPQYNFDPVLNKLQALSQENIANARTDAAAAKKQALIDAGSTEIAKGLGADQNTLDAAAANPFSTYALLQKDFGDRQRQLDENLNQQGLFYSGERIRQMDELQRGRAQAETNFGGTLRDLISNIDMQLQAAEEAETQRQIEAQIAAAQNGPGVYGGGGGDSGPPGTEDTGMTDVNPPYIDPNATLYGGSPMNKPTDPLLRALLDPPDPYDPLIALGMSQPRRPGNVYG